MTPAGAGRVRAGEVELSVRVSGTQHGVPVIVLHGFTGSARAMAPLTDRLPAAVAAAAHSDFPLRLIVPDLVGHGRSEAPSDESPYRVEAMASQVASLAGTLECDTFHLVGYSMGARVALTLGCTAPQQLRSLALIGGTAGIADPEERCRRAERDSARAERITSDFGAFVDEWMADPLFAGQAALGEEYLAAARAQRLASNPHGLALSLRHGGTGSMAPLHAALRDCDVPALLIAGFRDTKFCAIAEQLAYRLKNASSTRIGGAGHAAHIERPGHVAAVVAAFIAGVEEELARAGAHAPGSLGKARPDSAPGSQGDFRGDQAIGSQGRRAVWQ